MLAQSWQENVNLALMAPFRPLIWPLVAVDFLKLFVPLEAGEVELAVFGAGGYQVADARVALINVQHAGLEPAPVILLQLVSVGEGPEDVAPRA